MNTKALNKISYGLYIISSKKGDKINAQIANTAFQISNDPATIATSINKQNLPNEYIRDSGVFAVSVLSQETPLSFVGQFGFKSGRDTDKFVGVKYKLGISGVPYVNQYTLSYAEAKVIQEIDATTHTIFIGEVIGAEELREGLPMTYAFYQEVKRGSVSAAAPTFAAKKEAEVKMDNYVCTVCVYTYDPTLGDPDKHIPPGTSFADLPGDWTCPVCGVSKDDFEKE
jgi:flavin reductase (DIM6/NTAB) family NADH-FMN oxidoreductase RutF/rubredoxin